jgi:hypothetical protein
MAGRQTSVKRYVVRLSAEERERLEALIRKGKSPARRLLKARILLKADVSEAGDGWSDSRIIEALETNASMVYQVRKQLVEEGFEAVLSRKQPDLHPVHQPHRCISTGVAPGDVTLAVAIEVVGIGADRDTKGVPASYLALAGRVYIAPVAGSTQGHGLLPKKAGFAVRYIELGMVNPPGVLCQRCEFVRKS